MFDNNNIQLLSFSNDNGNTNLKDIIKVADFSLIDETIPEEKEFLKGKLLSEGKVTPHDQVFEKLIEKFVKLDFMALANVENRKDFKLGDKHYIVLSIECVLKFASNNSWELCKNNDFIYLYNGTFWSQIDKETFQKFLGEAAEKMGVPIFSSRFYQFRFHLFKQFLFTAYLPTPQSDSESVLINLQNGTFEISSNGTNLKPFNSSNFITYQLPFEYNPEAKAPIFEAYLNRVLPDIERQKVLAEYLGYVFIKHGSSAVKEEKALVLYGKGANGKSVFFEIVNSLLGVENISSYSLQSLTNGNGYFRAKLANKLLNYASEINGDLETSVFKQLVSGEPVEARLPYGQPFILKQYAKMIFNCNQLPKDVEHTNAYFRRFLIIPFDITIPPQEQDKQLHTKIIEKELSGVFNWVLQGLNRLLEQKQFSECQAAQRAVERYRLESDTTLLFLSDYEYKISTANETPLKNMFNDYRVYCVEGGFKSCSIQTFAERLRNAGFEITRRGYGNAINAVK